MTTNDIYIPPNCRTLDTIVGQQQIRLGIQGYPGVGKTWAALTFPNPIVLNLDRGLGAHNGRKDVVEIPFYDFRFSGGKTELKDRLVQWLEREGPKLTASQTLVVDGLSSLEVAYHSWFEANKMNFLSKSGKVDDFAEWQVKKKYMGEIMEIFKTFKCHVILVCHEAARADKPTTVGQPGEYNGKIRPLLTGAYGDIIGRDFTDWFRMHASDKPLTFDDIKPDALMKWGMKDKSEFKTMCDLYPRNTIYYFQLESDDKFDGKCSSLVNFPRFIPATYEAFSKYMRKVN